MSGILKKFKVVTGIVFIALVVFVLRMGIAMISAAAMLKIIINISWLSSTFFGGLVWIFLTEVTGVLLGGIGTGIFCAKYFPRKVNVAGIGIMVLSFYFYIGALLFGGLVMYELNNIIFCVSQVALLMCGIVGVFLGKKLVGKYALKTKLS